MIVVARRCCSSERVSSTVSVRVYGSENEMTLLGWLGWRRPSPPRIVNEARVALG